MKEITKKVLAGVGTVIFAGAMFGAGALMVEPQEKIITKTITEKVFVDVPVDKIVEKEVPVEVEVPVDNGNLDLVLDHIYDNDGKINYLLDDLKDDEVDQIVDRIIFINEAKKLAVDAVSDEGIDLVNKEVVNGTKLDDDDIERFKIYDDDEDIVVDDVDFEDSDAKVLVEAKFEQDDIDYKAVYEVKFKDGEVDDVDLESVELKD